jgi:hypothetical protein
MIKPDETTISLTHPTPSSWRVIRQLNGHVYQRDEEGVKTAPYHPMHRPSFFVKTSPILSSKRCYASTRRYHTGLLSMTHSLHGLSQQPTSRFRNSSPSRNSVAEVQKPHPNWLDTKRSSRIRQAVSREDFLSTLPCKFLVFALFWGDGFLELGAWSLVSERKSEQLLRIRSCGFGPFTCLEGGVG